MKKFHGEVDADDSGPLSRAAIPAYKLAAFTVAGAVGLLSGVIWFVHWDGGQARKEAQEVVAPLARELHDHITKTDAMIPQMQEFAREQRETMRVIRQNQWRVCQYLAKNGARPMDSDDCVPP